MPDEVKRAFNATFAGQSKSAVIARLMREAVEEEHRKQRRAEALERLAARKAERTRCPGTGPGVTLIVADASAVLAWLFPAREAMALAAGADKLWNAVRAGVVELRQPPAVAGKKLPPSSLRERHTPSATRYADGTSSCSSTPDG